MRDSNPPAPLPPLPPPPAPPPTPSEPRQEIAWGPQGRPIHPAITFDHERGIAFLVLPLLLRDGEASASPSTGGSRTKPYLIAVSPRFRNCIPLDLAAVELENEPVFLEPRSRWAEGELRTFLECKRPLPTAGDVYAEVLKTLTRHVEFCRPEDAAVLAVYVMLTYVAHALDSVPYLKLAGVKGSGKTKTCTILSHLGFNSVFTSSVTPAAVTRVVDGTRGFLVADEMEGLSSNGPFSTLLNGGYRRGARVIRCGGKGQLNVFASYGCKILASIEQLNPVLASRTILVTLSPAADQTKAKSVVTEASDDWEKIRAMLYEWSLTSFKDVVDAPVPEVPGLTNRTAELWGTLLRLASVIDQHLPGLLKDLTAFAKQSAAPAVPTVPLSDQERLLVTALTRLTTSGAATDVSTADILAAMGASDAAAILPSAQSVGFALERLRLYRSRRHTATGRRFVLDAARVAELASQAR